jgi:hypothetical protein
LVIAWIAAGDKAVVAALSK